jgi:hypothetical protein
LENKKGKSTKKIKKEIRKLIMKSKDIELLRTYYKEYIYGIGMPDFEKLDQDQKAIIYRSLGFSGYRLRFYFRQLGKELLKVFGLYRLVKRIFS